MTHEASPVPTVSWLLCSHVADAELRLAIKSCLTQTFVDFELVFVANGPEAANVAATVNDWFKHDHRLRVTSTDIHHLTFSLSLGLHLARAELVARMDGDDCSRPNRLQLQVAHMQAHPEVVVLGTAYEFIDERGRPYDTVSMPSTDRAIRHAMIRRNPFCHPSVMFRRSAILAAGGYLGGIHAQDYDLWMRLALNPTLQFANLPQVCLGYRQTGVGTARKASSAYAAAAASQFRQFAAGAGWRWAVAAVENAAKAAWRRRKRVERAK